MADTLATLAMELGAMPSRDRRAILRSLTAEERDAIDQAMADRIAAVDEDSVDPAGLFSPVFASCIAAARAEPSVIAAKTTAAARQALLAAADALDPARAPVAKSGAAPGRSLLDAFGGMLSPRTPRP